MKKGEKKGTPVTELGKMQVDKMKFAPYNPRKIDPAELVKLENSIKQFGVVENLVWNKQTGNVVGGNQRLKALRNLNIEECPVIIVDLPLAKEKILNLALNRISGDWDYAGLSKVVAGIAKSDRFLTGFDEMEITALLEQVEGDVKRTLKDTPPADDGKEPSEKTEEKAPADDGVSFVIYLTFPTIEAANTYLQEELGEDPIKEGKRTKVVVMG